MNEGSIPTRNQGPTILLLVLELLELHSGVECGLVEVDEFLSFPCLVAIEGPRLSTSASILAGRVGADTDQVRSRIKRQGSAPCVPESP